MSEILRRFSINAVLFFSLQSFVLEHYEELGE